MTKTTFIILITLLLTNCSQQKSEKVSKSVIECKIEHNDRMKNAIIVKVDVNEIEQEKSINSFSEKMPQLKETGIDVICIMPVQSILELTSGKYVKEYRKIDPDSGTAEELRLMIEKAHNLGMIVVLDWLINTVDSESSQIPIDYSKKDEQAVLSEAFQYWLQEFDIDGFYCNNPEVLGIKFWDKLRLSLNKIKPVILIAGNNKVPELFVNSFDMNSNTQLSEILEKVIRGQTRTDKLVEYFIIEDSIYARSCYRLRQFPFVNERNKPHQDQVKMLSTLLFTLHGMPVISSELVFMYPGLFKNLIKLRKENNLFWSGNEGGNFELLNTDNQHVFAFKRYSEMADAFVILNFSAQQQEFIVPRGIAGAYTDYFLGESTVKNENEMMKLDPWEYKIYLE